jgi:hypothetical protein
MLLLGLGVCDCRTATVPFECALLRVVGACAGAKIHATLELACRLPAPEFCTVPFGRFGDRSPRTRRLPVGHNADSEMEISFP